MLEQSVPFHPEGHPFAGYPFFIEDDIDKESWDALTQDDQTRFLRAVPYIQEKYPDEKLSVGMIGTILAVGG
ncbi:hypothetical protein [Brachybacterium timonense]|uniref:hypothetical protein n=1 Tax=Brachybacterium timonense TaxID=2050896 RepID=UPI000D0BA1C6|nr:hypothetical protein [Brachybacterium timonense]